MLFNRLSSISRFSLISPKKFVSVSNITKCELCGTANLFSEASDKPPKKPTPSYLRFFYGILPELTVKFPDRSYREKVAMGKNLWQALDINEKKQFLKSYHEDFDKYKMACLEYACKTKDVTEIEEQSTTTIKKEKRKLKKLRKLSGRPKKPPSAFFLFLKSKRGNLPKKQAVNWINDLLLDYNNLNENEKAKYQEEAKKLCEEYKKNICKWEDTLIKKGQADILYKRSKFKKND